MFRPDSAELITQDGTRFDIEKHGRLFYTLTMCALQIVFMIMIMIMIMSYQKRSF